MTDPHHPWASLDPIGLDELNGLAALETRTDRKYIVPPEAIESLLDRLGHSLRVLEIDGRRGFHYETVYFDTPHLDAYLAAARSRPTRFKVRTRTYLDSELSVLEVKTRDGRDRTVKQRLPYTFEDRGRLTDAGREFVDAVLGGALQGRPLRPVLANRYTRHTVLLPVETARATIDACFRCVDLDGHGEAALPGGLIVETKTPGRPSSLDHALWRAGHRPTRISKYCTGLAVARGGLPANKWHRTIVRHLEPVERSQAIHSLASVAPHSRAIAS